MLTFLARILIPRIGNPNGNKRAIGVAFVEFDSPAEASAALQGKSNQIMGGRYIEIFPSDPAQLSKFK
jgi:RNA recognition motif-containing protein